MANFVAFNIKVVYFDMYESRDLNTSLYRKYQNMNGFSFKPFPCIFNLFFHLYIKLIKFNSTKFNVTSQANGSKKKLVTFIL